MAASDALSQYQFTFKKSDEDYPRHRVIASSPKGEAGILAWHPKTGHISQVFVEEPYRRQGVATEMWHRANQAASATYGVRAPKHSPDRTNAGDAWARTVSKRLPKRLPVTDRGAIV